MAQRQAITSLTCLTQKHGMETSHESHS